MEIKTFKYFYPEAPRLIDINQELFEMFSHDQTKVAEKKYNGMRLCLHLNGGNFPFWNRHGEKLNYNPDPLLTKALDNLKLKRYCLFDGELRHNKTKGIRHKIVLFDVLIWNNELLLGKPFWYRRAILENLLETESEPLGITKQYPKNFRAIYEQVINDDEIEGLVIKSKGGLLELGRNAPIDSKWMWKVRKPSGRYKF